MSEQKPGTKDKVAAGIAGRILRIQTNVSDRVNRFKHLKAALIGFCVLSAALSGYYLIEAILFKPKAKIRIDRIHSPRPIEEPEDIYSNKIPEEIYEQIQAYRRYMDSTGESIRPGLADSMRTLEEMYLQQQK